MVIKENNKLLGDLFGYIRKRLQGEQAETLVEFARQYYQCVVFNDFDNVAVEDLYGAVLSHWNLALEFSSEQKIKVYNPTLEEHGWLSKHTIIEVVVKDTPFLLQSLSMEVNRHGYTNHLVIHPVYSVKRDVNGKFLSFADANSTEPRVSTECLVHLEIDRQSDPSAMDSLLKCLRKVLIDVRASTEDWQACLHKMQTVINELKQTLNLKQQYSDELKFLQWLHDDHFVFLGYREYEIIKKDQVSGFKVIPGTGLGVLSDSIVPVPKDFVIPIADEVFKTINTAQPLIITKATSRSTVHRPVFMDYIGIKQYNESGDVVGEKRFLGLYSSTAYFCLLNEIPLVSAKIRQLQDRFSFKHGSHRARALLFTLQSLPRDELFQADFDSLLKFSEGLLQLQQSQRVRVFIRQDAYGHFASVLVFVPRDRYYTETRKKNTAYIAGCF